MGDYQGKMLGRYAVVANYVTLRPIRLHQTNIY